VIGSGVSVAMVEVLCTVDPPNGDAVLLDCSEAVLELLSIEDETLESLASKSKLLISPSGDTVSALGDAKVNRRDRSTDGV